MNGAFLTGSRRYGTPRRNSDIDLVVLIEEPQTINVLVSNSNTKLNSEMSQEFGSVPFKFDNLNLIVCTTQKQFDAWTKGTKECVEKVRSGGKSLTRDEAIAIIRKYILRGE